MRDRLMDFYFNQLYNLHMSMSRIKSIQTPLLFQKLHVMMKVNRKKLSKYTIIIIINI